MELKNAVINFLGDSITEGVGASTPDKCFVSVFAQQFGAKANNYGVGGSRIARQQHPTSEPHDRDFCLRMEEMDESADAVVVFGGTNDFGHGDAPMGTPSDRTPETFWGACHYLMRSLSERYAGKPVVFVTPLHRLEEDSPDGDGTGRRGGNAELLREYRDVILEVALHYSIPVLDLFAQSGIQPRIPACQELLMPDGLHPSDEGHAIIARKIGLFLQQQ